MGRRPHRPRRKPLRWRHHDYAVPGCYFVTICTEGFALFLGSIENGSVQLSPAGRIVDRVWRSQETSNPCIGVDETTVMPDHLHGILWLRVVDGVKPPSLSDVVGRFKSFATRTLSDELGKPGRVWWQRGFHDRVIRNESELEARRAYIRENPERREQRP